jgi:hypothetical protein
LQNGSQPLGRRSKERQSFKKCWTTNALDGIEDDILWDKCESDCSDLKSDTEESVGSKHDIGCTSEEDGD